MLVFLLGAPALAAAQPIEEGPVEEEAAPITRLPTLLTPPADTYPADALAARLEATVTLQIDITAEGAVEAVEVLEPAEHAGYGFEEVALEAARAFRFTPAEAGGVPVPVRITWRYGFKLAPLPPAEEPLSPEPSAPAGVANFTGRLLERGTRDPLSGLIVTVFRGEGEALEGFEAVTDAEGRFTFYDLGEGDWRVLIEPDGYYPFRTTEALTTTEQVEALYFVERGAYNPFDVTVEASRPRKEVTRRTLQAREIELIPGNFGDPVKVVRNLPGVARSFFGSPAIVVRGSSPEDTRTYVDGVLVPLIYHFGGLRSIVPIGMIESIDFLPGNFSTYYGQSMGGVLDVRLKQLRPEAVHGYVDVNVFDAGVFVETPVGEDASIAVAARRSYIDSVLLFATPEDAGISVITAPRYYDYQVLGTWRPAPAHALRLFVFGSDDELKALFDNPQQADISLQSGDVGASTSFFRVMADHRYTPTTDFEHSTRVAVGRDTIQANLGDQFYATLNLLQLTFRDAAKVTIGSHTSLTLGIDATLGFLDGEFFVPRPRKEGDPERFSDKPLDPIYVKQELDALGGAAAYLELELTGIPDLKVTPGLRLERIEPVGEVILDPRVGLRYAVDPQWTLTGGLGIFHQPPSPDETAANLGNPNLRTEEATHASLGVEWRPLEYLQLDVTGFYKAMSSLVSSTSEVELSGDGQATFLNYNNGGRGRVYGLELLARHQFHEGFFGWISYTLLRAERLDFGESEWRLFDFDQTHILTVIGSWQLPYNWQLGASWRLTSGNPETPVIGAVFDSDADKYRRKLGAVNSSRLPPFHQLDVRVDKSWIYDTWRFTLYLDIQNVYNQTNTNFRDYNFDFSQTQPQIGLPVLPLLGVKSEF